MVVQAGAAEALQLDVNDYQVRFTAIAHQDEPRSRSLSDDLRPEFFLGDTGEVRHCRVHGLDARVTFTSICWPLRWIVSVI